MKASKIQYSTAGKMTGLLFGLLLFSCNDSRLFDNDGDNYIGEYSEYICFDVYGTESAVADDEGMDKETRGYKDGRFVLRSADTPDTLCVRATVADGIDGYTFLQKTPATRSAPISSLDDYGAFRVQAHCNDNGTPVKTFYMDDNVTYRNGHWNTDNVYYWPGATRTLQFFAWAPVDAGLTAPTEPGNTRLTYTVPEETAGQKDIVVAKTEEIIGNANEVVPLSFKHICTAVKFVTGSQMQAGIVKGVTLKGVKCAGTYDMAADKWDLSETVGDFSQTLDKNMSGTEPSGSEVTTTEGTFMMLPQTLPADAKVQVEFHSDATGEDRILEASIAGMEWPKGKTVTYKLSISPESHFKLDETRVLDAHYEILLTKLVVTDVPAGKAWTIECPTLSDERVTIQSQRDMNSYARQGYWTDNYAEAQGSALAITGSARGETVYHGTGSGEFPIAVFVPENVGYAHRVINLSVRFADSDGIAQTLSLTQLAPSWYGNDIGCERIESSPAPWGFYWESDFQIICDVTGCSDDDRTGLRQYIEWTQSLHNMSSWPIIGWIIQSIYGDDIPDLSSFVDMDKSGDFLGIGGKADKVTIRLGSLSTSGIAESTTDGQQNTRDVYNFNGIQFVNEIINQIQNMPGYAVTTEGTGVFPTNNASIACMKLNSWDIINVNDEQILTLTGGAEVMDPKWYLPATGETTGMVDEEYPLSGDYWTSTAVSGSNQKAYKHLSGGSISEESRNQNLRIRAVRKKT